MAYYDVIIKNGTVFNGEGGKPEKLDVGISGEEIKKLGDLREDDALKTIDASGLYVCPGFIDLTTHSDTHWTLFSDPAQESLVRQGVTTILGGSCGSSIAPLVGKRGLKNIGKWIDASKTNVNWQTTEELLYELERRRLGVNFATLVGLGTLFDSAGGQIEQMEFLLEKSLDQGAFGISTNLGLAQTDSLSDEDLAKLFKMAGRKKGITKHHLENEGKGVLPAISRLIQLSRKSGAPLHISHFKVLGKGAWPFFAGALKMLRKARKKRLFGGVNLTIDFFPYEKTGSDLFILLPAWLRKKGKEEILEILRSPENETRKQTVEYLKNLTLHYDKITIASSLHNVGNVGKSIAEISASTETPPEEVILNLLLLNHLHVAMFSEVISMEHVKELFKEEYAAAASDGVGYDSAGFESHKSSLLPGGAGFANLKHDLPHPRSFGSFPRFLKMAAKEGDLSWEEAIRKITSFPAGILGLKDRGAIKRKNKADIVVFDPEKISDSATYENPFQFPEGIEHVLINGEAVLSGNDFSEKLAGQILRKK